MQIEQINKDKKMNGSDQQEQQVPLPFVSRVIILTLIFAQFLDIITRGWVFTFCYLVEDLILYNLQVWRIITGWFYERSLCTLVLMVINLWSILPKFEIKNSSAVTFNDVFVNLYFFTGVFLCIQIAIHLISGIPQYGTFTFVFSWINILYKYCYYNSSAQLKICLVNKKIKLIYFPFLICLFIIPFDFFFNSLFRSDALMALTVGIIQCRFFNGGLILFVKDSYIDKNKAGTYLGFNKFQCWQSLNENNIQLNHRWTVSSSQFYIDLVNFQPSLRISQSQLTENNLPSQIQDTDIRINQDV